MPIVYFHPDNNHLRSALLSHFTGKETETKKWCKVITEVHSQQGTQLGCKPWSCLTTLSLLPHLKPWCLESSLDIRSTYLWKSSAQEAKPQPACCQVGKMGRVEYRAHSHLRGRWQRGASEGNNSPWDSVENRKGRKSGSQYSQGSAGAWTPPLSPLVSD